MARFCGEYPPDWPMIAWCIKTVAGWRSGPVAVLPVMPYVADAAKAPKVTQGVGLQVAFKPEHPERRDVGHRQPFLQRAFRRPTFRTAIVVSLARSVLLSAPVRAVVFPGAALPVGAGASPEVSREPGQSARIATEPLGRLAWAHLTDTATRLTGVRHPAAAASIGTVDAAGHYGGRARKRHTTSRTPFGSRHRPMLQYHR